MLMMAPLLFSHTSRIPSPNCVFSPSRQIPKQAKGKQRDLPIPYVSIAKTDRQLPELGGCVCVAVCVCVRVCVSVCVCVCVCQEASERTRRPTYKLHLQLARTLRLDVNRRAVHNQLDVNGRAVHNQLDVNGRAVHNQPSKFKPPQIGELRKAGLLVGDKTQTHVVHINVCVCYACDRG